MPLKQQRKPDGGLAVVSDASGLIERAREDDWAAWEFHADFECYTKRCTMLCLYDMRKISALLLATLIKSHPVVGLGNSIARNPFHVAVNRALYEKH